MTATEERINKLFEELVPGLGKADTVAGEIIRAVSRIAYRNSNDGDHIGVGYGKETCNPAARYLAAKAGSRVERAISDMWGVCDDNRYDAMVITLEAEVLAYLEQHPELKAIANEEDMWSYLDREEDVDDPEEDEEDYYEDEEDGGMVIYRGGVAVTLTPDEVRQAYEEQQCIYDHQNITDNLDWILEAINCEQEIGRSLEELRRNEAFVSMAARVSREKQNDEDISFTAAIQQGVKMALREVLGQ